MYRCVVMLICAGVMLWPLAQTCCGAHLYRRAVVATSAVILCKCTFVPFVTDKPLLRVLTVFAYYSVMFSEGMQVRCFAQECSILAC